MLFRRNIKRRVLLFVRHFQCPTTVNPQRGTLIATEWTYPSRMCLTKILVFEDRKSWLKDGAELVRQMRFELILCLQGIHCAKWEPLVQNQHERRSEVLHQWNCKAKQIKAWKRKQQWKRQKETIENGMPRKRRIFVWKIKMMMKQGQNYAHLH